MSNHRTESTIYFPCWKEQGKPGYCSTFGYTDKAEAVARAKEIVDEQAHRSPEYPPLEWIGIRVQTVINEYEEITNESEAELGRDTDESEDWRNFTRVIYEGIRRPEANDE